MRRLRLVSDCMARRLHTLSPEDEVNKAVHVLLTHGISGAPVVDPQGQLVGVLTEKDCLRAALEAGYYRDWGKTVSAYMTQDPVTMDAGLDVLEACQEFLDSAYRRFPVVQDGLLVGQISRTDVLRALSETWG